MKPSDSDGSTSSNETAPDGNSSGTGLLHRLKDHISPILSFIARRWVAHLIGGITLPPALITAFVFIYAVRERLPPLSVIDELGGHIIVVAIVSVGLFLIMLIYGSLPAVIQLAAAPSKKHHFFGKLAAFFYRLGETSAIAILGYLALSFYLIDAISLFKNTLWPLFLLWAIAVGIGFALTACVIETTETRTQKLQFMITSNSMSFFIMTLVYLALLLTAGKQEESILNEAYIAINDSIGSTSANIYASLLIVVTPIIAIVLLTFKRKDIRHTLFAVLSVSLFLLLLWPGAFNFVGSAFRLLKKGGGTPVVLWMPTEAGCRHKEIMEEPKKCDEGTSGSAKMKPIRLAFIDKEYLYFKVLYDDNDKATTNSTKYEASLLLPRSEISSIIYLDHEFEGKAKPSPHQ